MKRFLLIITVFLTGAVSCKSDRDVVAVYKGGTVTRGEFRAWMDQRKKSGETAELEKINLTKELQILALHKIAAIEAKSENYENSERFRFLMEDIAARQLAALMLEGEFKKSGFSAEAVKLRQILMPVEGGTEKDARPVLEKARRAVAELDGGASFADVVKKYSLHPSKNREGDIGWFVREMLPAIYADEAFALKKGAYTKKPLYLPELKSVGIIKVDDRTVLTPDNLERTVKDPRARSFFNEYFREKAKERLVKELVRAKNAVYHEQAAVWNNPAAVIFAFGGTRFTAGDLTARIHAMKSIMGHKVHATDDRFRKRVSLEYFHDLLLCDEARTRKLDKDPEYLKRLEKTRQEYLAGDYMEYVAAREMKVTPAEVRKEYESHRDSRYATVVRVDGRQVKRPRPFGEVKGIIEHTLSTLKEMDAREGWMRRMLMKYEFNITDTRIEKGL